MKLKILVFLLFYTVSLSAQVQMQQTIPLWQMELSTSEIDDLIDTQRELTDTKSKLTDALKKLDEEKRN